MSRSFRNNLRGQRFGRLTVLEFVPTEDKRTRWLCKCECGKTVTVAGSDMVRGKIKSCGCLATEKAIELHKRHEGTGSRLYRIWAGMKSRCNSPNNRLYVYYGGRGICMDKSWNDFTVFRDWAMSHGYDDTLSIDRIDNDKGYFPENCRWVDMKTQCRNRRSNTFVEYQGEKLTLSEASEKTGIDTSVLQYRHHRGDRGERLFRPVEKK